MKRAVELFTFEGLPYVSPHISMAWQTHSDPEPHEAFMSVAITHWQMVVTRQAGATTLSVQGPETTAGSVPVPADAEFFGIVFSLGTHPPRVDMRTLVGGSSTLRTASPTSVWLDSSTWELPQPHNADVFVDRLVRAGLLVHDPVVPEALAGDVSRAVHPVGGAAGGPGARRPDPGHDPPDPPGRAGRRAARQRGRADRGGAPAGRATPTSPT